MLDFKKKPIIAMLHMKSNKSMTALERMKKEIEIYINNGVDAVLVENYFGNMYDCIEGLEWLNKHKPDICYGVNILGDEVAAFQYAQKYGADFVQIDSVCGHLPPQRDKEYAEKIKWITEKYPHIQLLGGVRFKYQPVLSGRTLKEDIEIGKTRCTAIVTTGEGTGIDCPTEKLIEFKDLMGDFPLVAGAGVTADTVSEKLKYADGAIVGSYFKEGHNAYGEVCEEYVKELVNKAKA